MGAQVHTLLNEKAFRVTAETAAARDSDALFVTRKQSITFRGTENDLIKAFAVGSTFTTRDSGVSASEPKMLCQGPENIRLVDYTAGKPHWDCEVSWVGIHKSYHGDADFVYRIEDEFSRAQTEWPKTGTTGDGTPGATQYTQYLTEPFVSTPILTGGNPKRARIITWVPSKKVIGIMLTTEPLSPVNSKISALIKNVGLFPPPPTGLLKDWRPSNIGQGKTGILEPLWTWAPHYMEAAGDSATGGSWVPSTLQVRRHLSVGSLFVFTLDVSWEQRVSPG